jgi:Cdc6-like AAA superfamily ATPase
MESSLCYGDSSAAVQSTHGRKNQSHLFSNEPIHGSRFLFVHGPAGTGKSRIVQDYCARFKCRTAYIDCVGTNSVRCVFESILNQLAHHVPCDANSYTNFCRCDDMSAFVQLVKQQLVRPPPRAKPISQPETA